jgi:predicted secreted protein
MDLFGGIVVYVIVWWLVLFTVLPWGVRPPAEPGKGHATSAPARPRLLLKFAITTVIATGLWFVVDYVISSGILSLSDG